MGDSTLLPQLHAQRQPLLLVVVGAINETHGLGCRACHKPLPPGFTAVYVATSATPGVSGQLHFVCDAECGKQVLNEFLQIGATGELWSPPRLREWLEHDDSLAGVVGVREISTPLGPGLELCTWGDEDPRP